jgi:ketol-acid reductoisomerase
MESERQVDIYYDHDASLASLENQAVAIIGYGNQGRSQALNMRDSGLTVIVGSQRDASASRAEEDGFEVLPIAEAARQATIISFQIPDEVQADVYRASVEPALSEGKGLSFSHGYNIHFGLIVPPPTVDVMMVAPRMIGTGVRQLFVQGSGVPAYIAVAQDASGRAHERVLALAKAIGATRAGVLETTFAAETEVDLFMEQAVWAAVLSVFSTAYDVLVERGYSREEVLLELYLSGEAAEVFEQVAEVGFFKQLRLHSRTSQYGQLSRRSTILPADLHERFRDCLTGIADGDFAREWEAEKRKGFPVFDELWKDALEHPMNEVERQLKERILAS